MAELMQRVREILQKRGISGYQFAKELGVPPNTAWRWLTVDTWHSEPRGLYRTAIARWVRRQVTLLNAKRPPEQG